jgi:hypothetical protein
MKRTVISLVSVCVAALAFVPGSPASASLLVPKTPWPVCSSTVNTFCVESVSIQSPGQAAEQLTWVPSGTSAPSASASTVTTTTTLPLSTSTSTSTSTTSTSGTTQSSTALSGFWTDAQWATDGHAALGFGGIDINANAANEFSNYMLISVLPAVQDSSTSDVYMADQAGTNYQASLSPDDLITVALETGSAQPGVSMAIGNSFFDTVGTDANGSTLTFTASAVPTAVASSTSQCTGETGVAAAEATELQVIVAPENDPTSGFGVDGISGRMYVESNGGCELSTPTWNESTSSLSWIVAAPHFLPDGTTVNEGFYQAMIPGSDAALLWGLTDVNDAASALTVSVTSSGGVESQVAVSSVSVKGGNIIISSTGFDFSSPHFKISKNRKFNWASMAKLKSIRCEKGRHVKKVTAASPKCPAGYRRA